MKNPRNALAGGVSLILQMPLQQLLESAQWTCLLHFALLGCSREVVGVGLRAQRASSLAVSFVALR
jgi:hypothetical protein